MKDAGAAGADAGRPRRPAGHPGERVAWTRLVAMAVVRSGWIRGGSWQTVYGPSRQTGWEGRRRCHSWPSAPWALVFGAHMICSAHAGKVTMGQGDRTSGNLKSEYIIPRLDQTTEGLKGFRDIILSIFLPPDQIHVPRAPKEGAWRDSRSPPRGPWGPSVYCSLVKGFRLSKAWS